MNVNLEYKIQTQYQKKLSIKVNMNVNLKLKILTQYKKI